MMAQNEAKRAALLRKVVAQHHAPEEWRRRILALPCAGVVRAAVAKLVWWDMVDHSPAPGDFTAMFEEWLGVADPVDEVAEPEQLAALLIELGYPRHHAVLRTAQRNTVAMPRSRVRGPNRRWRISRRQAA
jgi:hypothetical protein